MSIDSVNNKITFNQSAPITQIYLARNWWMLVLSSVLSGFLSLGSGIFLIYDQGWRSPRLGFEGIGWTSVIIINCLCVCFWLYLQWVTWVQLRTEFTEEEVSQLTFWGRKIIKWKDITEVMWIRENYKMLEIRSSTQHLRISPQYYKDTNKLFDVINKYIPSSQK